MDPSLNCRSALGRLGEQKSVAFDLGDFRRPRNRFDIDLGSVESRRSRIELYNNTVPERQACGETRDREIEQAGQDQDSIHYINPLNAPVLSPRNGTLTSIRSSIDSHKLLIGVSLGKRRWRPDLIVPPPLPANSTGRSS